MLFKLLLWSTLVFFEFGSEMQLATALGTASSHLVRLGDQLATR